MDPGRWSTDGLLGYTPIAFLNTGSDKLRHDLGLLDDPIEAGERDRSRSAA
jgi:hypothetical protein